MVIWHSKANAGLLKALLKFASLLNLKDLEPLKFSGSRRRAF